VAVVSGRPVAFLLDVLAHPHGVAVAGLYGMETLGPSGAIETSPGAAAWRPVVGEVTHLAESEAPSGVEVERKGLTVTLHWRRHPAGEGWARSFSARETARTGLVVQPGRMALELRPPVAHDKGTVVRAMALGHAAVACFGDDLGDLPAFEALAELAGTGVAVARVAVVDAESPPEVALAADLVVDGPEGALDLLARLAEGC
jgi:trehalose 6-phosphate phosphatase